jgi:GNAT superfamily N-acetyltransferase
MTALTKQNKPIVLRKLNASDMDRLLYYLHTLSIATARRFQPHAYQKEDLYQFYHNTAHEAYVAVDPANDQIIAYTVLKKGCVDHDYPRLQQYGVSILQDDAFTIAPSVTDEWQSLGVGQLLLNYVIEDMKNRNVKQLILWGGVQTDNTKALHFYLKNGFSSLGHFQYNGLNEDMMLTL